MYNLLFKKTIGNKFVELAVISMFTIMLIRKIIFQRN